MRASAVLIGLAIVAASPLCSQSVLTPILDLGVTSPTKTAFPQVLRIPAAAGVPVEALLALQMEDGGAPSAHGPAELRVRSRGGEWLPLVASMPVT
ncbi:MAG TPA: hypothetical protein VFV54_07195, partial [Thermoanaerobaculia bacterium]|nr:hypothetical protein [Thermoanaerobaculia bacterium]